MISKILKWFGLLILVFVLGVLAVAATRPDDFYVERSAVINAPPEKIFPLIDDLRRWSSWSPFDRDPNMKKIMSGPEKGKGAVYAWEGNSDVGKGRMEITESVPSSKIRIQLDFFEPMEGQNIAEFKFDPSGKSTKVTWSMSGKFNYISKIICLFMDMDSMVGGDFETGLSSLKSIAEK